MMLRETVSMNAYLAVGNGSTPDEIRERLRGDDLAIVRQAHANVAEVLEAETRDFGWLVERLSDLAVLIALNASNEQIERWTEVVIRQVAKLPRLALCDALDEALTTCRYTNEVVPFLTDYVGKKTATAKRHFTVLSEIIAAADAPLNG